MICSVVVLALLVRLALLSMMVQENSIVNVRKKLLVIVVGRRFLLRSSRLRRCALVTALMGSFALLRGIWSASVVVLRIRSVVGTIRLRAVCL
jgi:hypothetical protein